MSDESTEPTDTTTDATVATAEPAAPAAPVKRPRSTGGQTYVDRYLSPLVIPVVAVGVILFYVLNLSRALISGTDTIAVVVAAFVTASILFGASALSAAPRMRSHTLAITVAVALAGLLFTGWITVGSSQEKKAAAIVACKPVTATIKVTALASLKLAVSVSSVKAGCIAFDYAGASGHTLAFHPPGPGAPELHSDSSGAQTFAWALTPGTYTIYCTVSGHEQAGMHATITVK